MQDTVRQERHRWIGGSDIGIILGVSPFKTRYELLLEKAQYKEDDFTGNVFTHYGEVMEPKIREYISKKDRKKYKEGCHIVESDDNGIGIRCHTDGESNNTIIEIKTTSEIHDKIEDYKLYIYQLLFYMVHLGKPNGILLVYDRPEDMSEEFDKKRLQIFRIRLDDYEDLIDEIIKAELAFREDLQKVKADPFISEVDLMPKPVVSQAETLSLLETQVQAIKAVEKQIEVERQKLYDLMCEYEIKSIPLDTMTISRVDPTADSTKPVFDEKKFAEDHPKMYNTYMTEKITKGKKGYVKVTPKKEK